MIFVAKLNKNSHLWKAWRARHAIGGDIAGVQFHMVAVGEYESRTLTADEVVRLRGMTDVSLKGFAEPVAARPVVSSESIVAPAPAVSYRPPPPVQRAPERQQRRR